jgi:hypothetical protein
MSLHPFFSLLSRLLSAPAFASKLVTPQPPALSLLPTAIIAKHSCKRLHSSVYVSYTYSAAVGFKLCRGAWLGKAHRVIVMQQR